MFNYALRRILYSVPIAIGVSLVCFLLLHIAPGDPIDAIAPESASPQLLAELRAAYGFDRSLPVQYFSWLSNVVVGDFGTSIMTGRPVLGELANAVVNTLLLSGGAVLVGFVFGLVLGTIAGYTAGSLADRVATAFAVAGISVPNYWLGLVLVVIFAVNQDWLPAMGMGQGAPFLSWANLRHFVLPVIALSVIPAGIIARSVRGTVAEVRKQEFVQTLHAKGLSPFRVFVHVMKNSAPALLAVMGLQLGYLMGGSILVETVFSWPGTGFLLNTAIFTRDLPLLQGTILILSMFFVVINLVVDLAQALFDPRIERN